jgi:hypothetical protein
MLKSHTQLPDSKTMAVHLFCVLPQLHLHRHELLQQEQLHQTLRLSKRPPQREKIDTASFIDLGLTHNTPQRGEEGENREKNYGMKQIKVRSQIPVT